jgi:glyoxylase-like metal-dependent hydrolase (beta-lactamase superfamily II)
MEITSVIHRINGVRGARCYLVITEAKMPVFDRGISGNINKIIKCVKTLEKNPYNINYVILNRADIDHIGCAVEMKEITDTKLAIHASDAPILCGRSGFNTIRRPLRVLFKLMTRLMRFHVVEPDIILGDDFETDGFKVI